MYMARDRWRCIRHPILWQVSSDYPDKESISGTGCQESFWHLFRLKLRNLWTEKKRKSTVSTVGSILSLVCRVPVDLVTFLTRGIMVLPGKLGETEEVPTFTDPLREDSESGGWTNYQDLSWGSLTHLPFFPPITLQWLFRVSCLSS